MITNMSKFITDCISDAYNVVLNNPLWGESLWLIHKEGKGIIRCSYEYNEYPDSMCISDLVVIESERNKGIGTELIKLAEQIAKNSGFEEIHLAANRYAWTDNWYRRMGYTAFYEDDTMRYFNKYILNTDESN